MSGGVERGTLKTRTIFIATRGKTSQYRTIEEVPPGLRRRLLRSTSGSNCGTILIADPRGLQALIRAGLRETAAAPAPPPPAPSRVKKGLRYLANHWTEISVSGAVAVLLWLALSSIR